MNKLSGTHITIIVVAFLAGMSALLAMGRSAEALTGIGVLLLGGLGFQISQTAQVKENTNGTLSAFMKEISRLNTMLAASQPTPEVVAMAVRPVSSPPALAPEGDFERPGAYGSASAVPPGLG